jgi:hypothetical protein
MNDEAPADTSSVMSGVPVRLRRTWLKDPRTVIRVDGPGAARDLIMLGFISEEEAAQVGMVVVEALREAFPDHAVTGLTFESNLAQADANRKARYSGGAA